MADGGAPETDLGELTPTQQEALQQYTDVTSQEVSEAIAVLQRSQWNVQVRRTTLKGPNPSAPLTELLPDCYHQVL